MGPAGSGPGAGSGPRVLLLGNSRWHWAERQPAGGLRCWHQPPGVPSPDPQGLAAWAAVGALPEGAALPSPRRIGLQQVPLAAAPPWLGIDRALAGWWAWRQQRENDPAGVLVVDAGTALTFTRVDRGGRFAGGRIQAGVGLQLRSLAAGTALLPALTREQGLTLPADLWPHDTAAALVRGCLEAAAAATAAAWRDVGPDGAGPHGAGRWRLWITGGDAPALLPLLEREGLSLRPSPDLCLEALAALAGI